MVSWRSDEKLKAGMLVTVEPGVYLPGIGGVRIEDDVIVTPKGCRVLTHLSKKIEDAVI
jgi:Xaa-Pro aminopeptidase